MEGNGNVWATQLPNSYNNLSAHTSTTDTEPSMDSIKKRHRSWKKIFCGVAVIVIIVLVAAGFALWPVWSRIHSSGSSIENKPTVGIQLGMFSQGMQCEMMADVLFILDQSTSIVFASYDNWYVHILGFVRRVVDSFYISTSQTQVGVVKFSSSALVAFYLNQYTDKGSLDTAINSLDIEGGETNIASALRLTRFLMYLPENGAREGVRRLCILLTDGSPNRETNLTLPEANATKAAGIEIYTIGITSNINQRQLQDIASDPADSHYYFVDDYSALDSIVNQILQGVCAGDTGSIEVSRRTTNRNTPTQSRTALTSALPPVSIDTGNPETSQQSTIGPLVRTTPTGRCYGLRFQCSDGTCIYFPWVCDGFGDCPNGEDESVAVCGTRTSVPRLAPTTSSACQNYEYQCLDGSCIYLYLLCDGYEDCWNGDDEGVSACGYSTMRTTVSQGCPSSSYRCSDGRCISLTWLCDGDNDCGNNEDEVDATCVAYCDRSQGFMCRDGRQCIASRRQCNFVYNCYDGSDEVGCGNQTTTTPRTTRTTTQYCSGFRCSNGACIPYSWLCDGDRDCSTGEDEIDNTCVSHCNASQGYMCQDGLRCIARRQLCDRVNQCNDGSDESECVYTTTSTTPVMTTTSRPSTVTTTPYCYQFRCNDGRCISTQFKCDGVPDCSSGEDESPAICDCTSSQFRCDSGSCISASYLCDGYSQCSNREDEVDATCVKYCKVSQGFLCDGEQLCVKSWNRCDGVRHCRDGSDEINCVTTTTPSWHTTTVPGCSQFQCNDGRCIASIFRCDGIMDCLSGEDESPAICASISTPQAVPMTTVSPHCGNSSFGCSNGRCIALSWLCDGDDDCGNREDENDATCVSYCNASRGYKCLDGLRCVPTWRRCDHVQHCRDGSDEIGCATTTTRPTTTIRSTTTTRRISTIPPCYNFRCYDGSCIALRFRCDGISDCPTGEDESSTICGSITTSRLTTTTPRSSPISCTSTQYACSTGRCISLSYLCDGDNDCGNLEDEVDSTCVSYCNVSQGYLCSDGQRCIRSYKYCDGVHDCRDGSDEIGCARTTTPPPRCSSYQFQCPGTGSCIPLSYLCDGSRYCSNGEDEDGAICVSYCNASQGYLCKDKQRCVPSSRRCDGISHCQDGSDEIGCVCRGSYQPCNNGMCVYSSYWCDGTRHCSDGSDELPGCYESCTSGYRGCPKENKCISSYLFCNGIADCSDGADEKGCGSCTRTQFQCNDTRCIDLKWICDGNKDCSNGEDELLDSCKNCSSSEFQCVTGNTTCVSLTQRCDGTDQCMDASDEAQCLINGADGAANPGDFTKPLTVTLRGQTNNYICADGWNKTWSDVVCRQLGYRNSNMTSYNLTIPVNGQVLKVDPAAYSPSTGILSSLSHTGLCVANKAIGISCTPTDCGMRAIPSEDAGRYIINGEEAVRGAWPWHVYLQIRTIFGVTFCGASLLNERWVLTATHCVEDITADNVTVQVGSIYLSKLNSSNDSDVQSVRVDKLILHPEYFDGLYSRNVVINDVALLRLRQPVTFSETVRPICIAPTDIDLRKFKVCVATGFGVINYEEYTKPTVLRQGKMNLMTTDECYAAVRSLIGREWSAYRSDFNYMICAGSQPSVMGVSTCKGDSGGPLACQDQQNVWTVVGVTSFGFSGCKTSVFARVSQYYSWINNQMALHAVN